jgi:K+-sensing histidine kinase KdpD
MKSLPDGLYESTLKFLTPFNLESTYREVAKEAMKLLDGSVATIFMAERNNLKRVYSSSPHLLPIQPRKNGYTYGVFKTQKSLILSYNDIEKIHPEINNLNIKYDLMAPLVNKGKAIGVISILSRKKKFTKNDQDVLNFFTPLASMAIRKAQLYKEVEDALKTRDLFISMASHELKTPITTMYIYTQLLKNKVKKGEEFDIEWINNLLYEMARLTKLIDELLQLSQIKTGNFKYNFEELNIFEIIDKSLSSFKLSHKNSKVVFKNLTKKNDIRLVGDPDKLVQVFINLLDNSSKHNVWDKPILMKITTQDKMLKISVEDSGSGIKKEDLPHIFDEFYKGKGHTKLGMGLGLYLIKKIIDKHHGKISIKSEIDKGTTVNITLPMLYDA